MNLIAKIREFFDGDGDPLEPGTPEYFIAAADQAYEEAKYGEALDNYCRAAKLGSELAIYCLREMYDQTRVRTASDMENLRQTLAQLAAVGDKVSAQVLSEINADEGIAGKIYRTEN